jgi:hypothetical protein
MQSNVRVQFTGPFKALDGFADRVAKVPSALVTVSEQLAEETIELIREGYEKQRDPYGKKWADHAPLTKKLRPGGRILEDTGGQKAAWHRKGVSGQGFSVANAKKSALFAQKGTGIFGPRKQRIEAKGKTLRIPSKGGPIFLRSVAGAPKRRLVPDGRLPKGWVARYVETANDVLTELFR